MSRLFVYTLCGSFAVFGIYALWDSHIIASWTTHSAPEHEGYDYYQARSAFERGDFEQVTTLAQPYIGEIEKGSEQGKKWLALLIQSSMEAKNVAQLTLLFEFSPEAFQSNEAASLLVANGYLISGNQHNYEVIRSLWEGNERQPDDWFLLDVDYRLLNNQRNQAVNMLKAAKFEGKADTRRLIRLGALLVMDDPKQAWEVLNLVEKIDPANSDIYLYKGQLLTALQKHDLALQQYLAAVRVDNTNPHLWEVLGDQYINSGDIEKGVAAYQAGLEAGPTAPLWMKTFFWTKVGFPHSVQWNQIPVPTGKAQPLISYYNKLPDNAFWDAAAFAELPYAATYIKTEPTAYWLYVLGLIQNGNDRLAAAALQNYPFVGAAWSHPIHTSLMHLAQFRSDPKLSPVQAGNGEPNRNLVEHTNASQTQWPKWVTDLAVSGHANGIALIEAGWLKSGLSLLPDKKLPPSRPDAIVMQIMRAYEDLDGDFDRAIKFGLAQTQTSGVSMEIARIFSEQGNTVSAIAVLERLPKEGDAALPSQQMLLQLVIGIEDWKKAYQLVEQNALLRETVKGKEVVARQALEANDLALATTLYNSIVDDSAEAKGFLARKAFNEKNYTKASELTEQLIQLYPDNLVLKENLQKILREQQRHNQSKL